MAGVAVSALCPEATTSAVHRAALKSEAARHTALTNLMGGTRGLGTPGPGEAGSGNESEWFFPVDVSCACGHAHPGAPADASGCGVSFRVEFAVSDDGTEQ